MSHKKLLGSLLSVSFLGLVSGWVLSQPDKFGICDPGKIFTCIEPIGNNIGQPLMMGSAALFLVFFLLFFLPHHYFRAWLKYAAWFIAVAVVWIWLTPVQCHGGGFLSLCLDKELATWWSSGIFLALSGLVLITNSLGSRVRETAVREK